MSLAAIATSVPVPMAMPTSAWARAGESLMPSPTIATGPSPWAWSCRITAALSAGRTSAITRSIPARAATSSAVRRASPLSITSCSPWRRRAATAAAELGLRGSEMPKQASIRPSSTTAATLQPTASSSSTRGWRAAVSMPSSSNQRGVPTSNSRPAIAPRTPQPATASKPSTASSWLCCDRGLA